MTHLLVKKIRNYPLLYRILARIFSLFFTREDWRESLRLKIASLVPGQGELFFIQVGSNDGVQGDPLREFIVNDERWVGVFIEPVKYLFEKLKANYGGKKRYLFENKAIAPHNHSLDFYYVDEKAKEILGDSLPPWYDKLGSFNKQHIIKHLGDIIVPYILEAKVDSTTLDSLIEKYNVAHISLLHIDTEGFDYKVLSTLDLNKHKPSIIIYEHKHLSMSDMDSAQRLLSDKGYKSFKFGGDTLATIL